MKKFWLIILLFPAFAWAATATLTGSLTLPTTKLNGDPITAADIYQINIYYGVGSDPGATGNRLTVPTANAASFLLVIPVMPNPAAQTIYLRASVTGRDAADPTQPGLEGGVSPPVTWIGIIDAPTDSPPGIPVLLPFSVDCSDPPTCTVTQQ